LPPARNLRVDDGDAGGGDEDRGVSAAALQDEQVVRQLLDVDDLRLVWLGRLRGNGGQGAGREQDRERVCACHVRT